MAAPAISILTGIGVAITGLATVALGAWRILKAAGLVGATGVGSTPKVPVAPGQGVGGLSRLLGLGGAAAGAAGSGLTKGDQDRITSRLGRWAQEQEKSSIPSSSGGPASSWIDPPARTAVEELKRAVEENTLIHKQSFESEGSLSGLIHRANLTSASPATGVRSTIESMGARIHSAAIGSPSSPLSGSTASGGYGLGPLAGSIPGSALNGGSGLSRRGIIGGGVGIPGAGGGSASSNPANSAASSRMLDAIAATESGRAGYDAVLGNGKYGTPSKPVSTMTMDEAFAFGRQIKSRHGSSSALGRYQIVGNTMRAAQKALGIDGSAPFNAENQDRMARWIARSQGLGAWEGLKGNPQAMATARAAMAEGGAKDVPSGASAALGAGIPGLGGSGQYDGLRMKGQQAIAGGQSFQGVTDLARQVQASLPGGVRHFSAFNDRYHQGTGSKHASGLAFDTTLIDAAKSSEAAEAIRNKIRAAGIGDDAFKVIDEYRNPSARSTGGHIHSQFNTAEAAKKYSDYIDKLKQGSGGDVAAKADAIRSSGWKPGAGNNSGALGTPTPLGSDTTIRAQNTVPLGGSGGGASGGGQSATTTNTIHINGAGQDAESIANAVQRKLNDKINRRTTDFSPSALSV